MPRVVVARDGECLCGLAIRHGFLDCDPLRAEGDNAGLLKRPLRAGDRVTIPDPRPKQHAVAVDARHGFKRRRRPEPSVRFVHGSPSDPYPSDPSLAKLEISNYRTDRAGSTGAAAFADVFGFEQDAHDDPDTFKVEVVSPDGGDPIEIRLQALEPVYDAVGTIKSYEEFTGADAAGRSIDVECELVGASAPRRYRSRYLRLVTDDLDQAAAPTQTLLVTDTADGNAGSADRMEILDQRVRASYELPSCPAAAPDKCRASAELPVGEDRQRIRMTISIFRTAVGGAAIGGITEQHVRRRTFKWFRRAFAQISLAPKLVEPVRFLDPPAADMIAISDPVGTPASGVDGTGNPSTLTFDLDVPPLPLGAVGPPAPTTITINPAAGRTPTEVCNDIVAALPAGFTGAVHTNATPTDQATPSADVIVTRTDGTRVVIRNEATTDTALTIGVARVDVTNINPLAAGFANLMVGTPEGRRLLRFGGTDDRLDFYVVGTIPGARGVAFIPATDLAAQYRPPPMCRWAVLMRDITMDGGDAHPFTFPHEAGHVLTDAFHADNADPNVGNQLMTGTGTSPANAMTGSKRISDDPVQVQHQKYDPAQASPGDWHSVRIQPTKRFRSRGAPVYEGW